MGSNQPTMVQTTTIILVLLGLLGQIFASPDEAIVLLNYQIIKLINAKDEKISGLEGKVEQLEELISAKDEKISGLEGKVEQLDELINAEYKKINGLRLINAKDGKITGLEGKVEQLEELINAKDAKISHQEKKNEELERLIKQLQQQVEKGLRKVFFSARAFEESTDSNGVITFTHIKANEGEGFNKESGRFRAPVGGTYELEFVFFGNGVTSQNRVEVYKDGSHDFSINVESFLSYTWMSKLSPGEEVYLKVGTGKLSFVQFSGKLLKADD